MSVGSGTSKKTMKVRVDKHTWYKLREILPGITDANISRMLFSTSLLKMERKLHDMDFKDKVGAALYGKKVWKRKK